MNIFNEAGALNQYIAFISDVLNQISLTFENCGFFKYVYELEWLCELKLFIIQQGLLDTHNSEFCQNSDLQYSSKY